MDKTYVEPKIRELFSALCREGHNRFTNEEKVMTRIDKKIEERN
jgi:hypothetical protein